MTNRLVIMGPPGAGKGTQAKILSERLRIPHVSSGDIFRANVEAGTELGRRAGEYVLRGEYVPDELTNAMVRDRLYRPDCEEGFILDGYPRTVAQVDYLDQILADHDAPLDRVLELTVDTDAIVERLLKRAQLEGRVDDTADVIRRRLEVYAEQTLPLTTLYAERGLLIRVDGMGSVEEVSARALEALSHPASA
jgi:adenylate kinase